MVVTKMSKAIMVVGMFFCLATAYAAQAASGDTSEQETRRLLAELEVLYELIKAEQEAAAALQAANDEHVASLGCSPVGSPVSSPDSVTAAMDDGETAGTSEGPVWRQGARRGRSAVDAQKVYRLARAAMWAGLCKRDGDLHRAYNDFDLVRSRHKEGEVAQDTLDQATKSFNALIETHSQAIIKRYEALAAVLIDPSVEA